MKPSLYYIAILIAILSSTSYHLTQKASSQTANPALVLMVAYLVGFVGSFALFLIFPLKTSLSEGLREMNWASFFLGVTIIGIEIGFLLAYRSGWNINTAALLSNLTVTLILIPIGLAFFKESLTPTKVIGMVVCVIGLVMINR